MTVHQMFLDGIRRGISRPHLERYRDALTAAGIASELDFDILVIPVEQPEVEGS